MSPARATSRRDVAGGPARSDPLAPGRMPPCSPSARAVLASALGRLQLRAPLAFGCARRHRVGAVEGARVSPTGSSEARVGSHGPASRGLRLPLPVVADAVRATWFLIK